MVKFFVAATGLAVGAQALDCKVSNGGCSHSCNSDADVCECPSCWELGADGFTCQPAAGTVTTTCGSSSIKMTIQARAIKGFLMKVCQHILVSAIVRKSAQSRLVF